LFGRDELVEKIVGFAEHLTPVALIGPGGIGKTSTILTVLHDDRVKQLFGDNRRFIRCDQFPASCADFLRRLSEVIGAGAGNPRDLTPLRPLLSSKKMLIVLDNAESILGLQGTSGQEIHDVMEELSHFSGVWLCITSRISTVPPDCEALDIPTLTMEAARDTFYRIYERGEHSEPVDNILAQLDFHPLSIALLATVAQHNKWDTDRLTREWERQRTAMLRTRYSRSLATTIELSLTSPMFQELGPDARALLGVVAFFPHGVDENNLGWLFPTIPDIANIFDTFCVLSLTSRSNGFVTMLAPLRDYFYPQDPTLSPLLCATKDHYSHRLSVDVYPDKPGYQEARWITSEDTNIEHLLNVFTSTDTESSDIWDACGHFMEHLRWHKLRLVSLGPKIEGLSDSHPSKPQCLYQLSQLFRLVENFVESKRLLSHALEIWRERGDGHQVARTLERLSEANRALHFREEGMQRAKEALEAYEQLGDVVGQTECLRTLGFLLCNDKQLDAAEEAASRAVGLLPEKGNEYLLFECHCRLGEIYRSKGEIEKALHHFETVLGIASSFGWRDELSWYHYYLAVLFSTQGRFDDANAHVEHAKSHAFNSPHDLGFSMYLQAAVYYLQSKLDQAKSEALRAVEVVERLGVTQRLENCRELLGLIDSAQEREAQLPPANRISTVSSWKQCCLLPVLTPFFSIIREPNDRIGGCLDFPRRVPLRVTDIPLCPP